MKLFKRKKPNNIFELPIDKAALYDACILSTLFHLVGELKDPIFSYEQSWNDNHIKAAIDDSLAQALSLKSFQRRLFPE